jgi:RNA polymerase sigma-70 factor (ECF subfamily)
MSDRSRPSNAPDAPPHASASEDDAPWRPFVRGLRAFISRRVPSAHADDVVQDALLRLHESAASLRDADRAEAWVFTIARRTIADFYRERDRRPVDETMGAGEDVVGDTAPPETVSRYDGEHDVHEEVLSWLRPMAEELPEMYARPLIMADFEGHTQQEVADEIGLSLSGAKSRVQRARTRLRKRLEACCEIEFGPEGRAVGFRRRSGDACEGSRCED